jgi:hypothetical protein
VAVVELAKAFASTLSDEQLSELNQHYSLKNAANWSNFPHPLPPTHPPAEISRLVSVTWPGA